jgi:ketosteroid isomerase-like protein
MHTVLFERRDRAPFEAWNRGDLEGWVALFDPDCEFASALETSVAGGHPVYRGHDGLRAFWHEAWETWESFQISIEGLERRGDTLLASGSFRAKGRESGAEVEREASWVNRYRGDRIVWSRAFFEREEALSAAGRRG